MKYKYCKDVTFEGTEDEIRAQIKEYCVPENLYIANEWVELGLEIVDTPDAPESCIELLAECKKRMLARFDRWLRDNTKVIYGVRYTKKELQKKLEEYDIHTLADGSITLLSPEVPGATLALDQIKQILINQIINCADS